MKQEIKNGALKTILTEISQRGLWESIFLSPGAQLQPHSWGGNASLQTHQLHYKHCGDLR